MTIVDKYRWVSNCLRIGKEKIHNKLEKIFSGHIDQKYLNELEELLITYDTSVAATKHLIDKLSAKNFNKKITIEKIRKILAEEIIEIVQPIEKKLEIKIGKTPQVILFCGVNGNGKTTTLGKLAYKYKSSNKSVVIAACDTFRAAAREQLEIWARYSECDIITGEENSDPASIAYRAMSHAKEVNADVLLIDTSGRLHTYKNFMEELAKMVRILKKHDESAPHNTILVLDASTGQNALNQVRVFKEMVNINGFILTKLDGTAKGGIIISLAKQYPNIALHHVGTGEGIDDIEDFSTKEFVYSMFDIKNN